MSWPFGGYLTSTHLLGSTPITHTSSTHIHTRVHVQEPLYTLWKHAHTHTHTRHLSPFSNLLIIVVLVNKVAWLIFTLSLFIFFFPLSLFHKFYCSLCLTPKTVTFFMIKILALNHHEEVLKRWFIKLSQEQKWIRLFRILKLHQSK